MTNTSMGTGKDEFSGSVGPDIAYLQHEYDRAWHSDLYNTRSLSDQDTRLCRWEGQGPNGKKEKAYNGDKAVFPWEGANDGVVRLADQTARDLCDLWEVARARASLDFDATEFNDITSASTVLNYMRWLTKGNAVENLEDELKLSANHQATYGFSIGHVCWDRRESIEPRTITLEMIAVMMMELGLDPEQTPPQEFVTDYEEYVTGKLGGAFTDSSKAQIQELVQNLKEGEEGQVYVKSVTRNRPSIRALEPFLDVVFPEETTDLQRARVIFRRERYSVVELEQVGQGMDWDPEFVEAAKETAGTATHYGQDVDYSPITTDNHYRLGHENLVEIVYAYSRRSDAEGRVGIWETVFCPHVDTTDGELFGAHTLLEAYGDSYPFFEFTLERLKRNPAESRGVSIICREWQREIKVYFDQMSDYTTISSVPPLVKPRQMTDKLDIRPLSQIPATREGISWLDAPSGAGVSVSLQIASELEKRNARYWGLEHPEIPSELTMRTQQAVVSRYLSQLSRVYRMLWRMVQRYGSDEEFQRVTNTQERIPRDGSNYDFVVSVDVREMNPDFLDRKLQTISNLIAPLDRTGQIDWSKLVPAMVAAVDPTYLAGTQSDSQRATMMMYEEVLNQVIAIADGNEPMLKREGPSGEAKVQILASILENNPLYQQRMAEDQRFAEAIKKYQASLVHGYEQNSVNPSIGRLGAEPSGQQMDLGI